MSVAFVNKDIKVKIALRSKNMIINYPIGVFFRWRGNTKDILKSLVTLTKLTSSAVGPSYIWGNRGNCLGKIYRLGKNLACLPVKIRYFPHNKSTIFFPFDIDRVIRQTQTYMQAHTHVHTYTLYSRGLQLAARGPNLAREGQTIGPRASPKCWIIFPIFFKIHFLY